MMESGKLKAILYGKYQGLNDVGRALGDLAARKVYGKIVITVEDPEDERAKL
jgi:NADPH2:quinone reductase